MFCWLVNKLEGIEIPCMRSKFFFYTSPTYDTFIIKLYGLNKYPCCVDLLVHVLLARIVARELLFMIQVNLKCLDFCSQSQISNHMYMFSTSRNYENQWKNLIYRFGFVEAYVDFNLGNLSIISIWKWLLWTSKQAPVMMRL